MEKTEADQFKVMIAVNDSPESKAAFMWAVENLLQKGDPVLIYHTVKTPHQIPTASKWI